MINQNRLTFSNHNVEIINMNRGRQKNELSLNLEIKSKLNGINVQYMKKIIPQKKKKKKKGEEEEEEKKKI